jgi:hypothetical protein
MAENRFKRWLDWAHHVYWIRELLLSLGIGKILQVVASRIWAIPHEWQLAIWLITSGLLCWLLAVLLNRNLTQKQRSAQNVPTALFATSTTPVKFDVNAFFRNAYYSQIQEETEANVRAIAALRQPKDREDFYAKLIGIGITGYVYDQIWWEIFRSQILALLDLNRAFSPVPISRVQTFYTQAAAEYKEEYKDRTFEKWLAFLESYVLIIKYPSDMVEIAPRGKDFLKFLVHWGRDASQRRL